MQEQAEKDNCNLDTVKILPATARYISSMEGWLRLPYANLITALWAIEYSYFKVNGIQACTYADKLSSHSRPEERIFFN